ncbi:hypothetical protein ACWOA4_09650 [Pediococcus pentosaceus]|jgi:hypothetical protein|uniref:Uncharacterized protein n=1 Tax=Pediococcus pentosaceus TaxID=1255 RepID=A0AA40XAL6_PEDPE|nr:MULTISPECIES: hypothetical protein [Bacilli]MBF2758447.1 hypothetical protein [Staphylococcus haemolyticus]MBF2774263.1 hypothetical protein [Staphylococcus haemolyticus]MBF2776991.1 hypothetical protein [Staphylococcus haemolyticus]MBF2816672.1 hypothetical protein [Staphylococcus haemolyticus]MBF7122690.1 hypothetical protein [Pediococcus pentosaceus]
MPYKEEAHSVQSRVSKSYTLKPEIAEELAQRAEAQELTASRYLEKVLRDVFKFAKSL